MIKAIAISAFTHGSQNLQRGDEAEFSPPTFTALAAHGLVREKVEAAPQTKTSARAARTPANKKAPELLNKSEPADPSEATTDAAGAEQGAENASAESGQAADTTVAGVEDAANP